MLLVRRLQEPRRPNGARRRRVLDLCQMATDCGAHAFEGLVRALDNQEACCSAWLQRWGRRRRCGGMW